MYNECAADTYRSARGMLSSMAEARMRMGMTLSGHGSLRPCLSWRKCLISRIGEGPEKAVGRTSPTARRSTGW